MVSLEKLNMHRCASHSSVDTGFRPLIAYSSYLKCVLVCQLHSYNIAPRTGSIAKLKKWGEIECGTENGPAQVGLACVYAWWKHIHIENCRPLSELSQFHDLASLWFLQHPYFTVLPTSMSSHYLESS